MVRGIYVPADASEPLEERQFVGLEDYHASTIGAPPGRLHDLAQASWAKHYQTKKKGAAHMGDSLTSLTLEAPPNPAHRVGVCSKPHLVGLAGAVGAPVGSSSQIPLYLLDQNLSPRTRGLKILVGVFSSYADKLQQGWRLLKRVQVPEEIPSESQTSSIKLTSPRSLARITPERLRLMIVDYEAGMTTKEIGAKYGHSRDTVMKHLAAAGIRSRVAKPTESELSYWQELRAEGLGFKTIARKVGWNIKTIKKYLRH